MDSAATLSGLSPGGQETPVIRGQTTVFLFLLRNRGLTPIFFVETMFCPQMTHPRHIAAKLF
jgi:hypothetical protein